MERALRRFLDAKSDLVLVEVTEARGSTPREIGAWMLVGPTALFGTIGGGQLEFLATDRARALLESGGDADSIVLPLGPEIGQCCGGRVGLALRRMDGSLRDTLLSRAAAADAARPSVFLFGGGHVGAALAASMSLLPLAVHVVETRAEALDGISEAAATHLTAVPEEWVARAPAGSAFVVLTHDHALDFLIVAAALARSDAAYVGMIGSATKRATFRSWYLKTADGSEAQLGRLVCPIGGTAVHDKRPAVIAALAAAEIMIALSNGSGSISDRA